MIQISSEAKEMIVKKALTRGNETLASIANANGVGQSTLNKWLMHYRKNNGLLVSKTKSSVIKEMSRTEKFNHLMNTAHLDETSVGAYCRKHGLYSHQLQRWRATFMETDVLEKGGDYKSKLKVLKAENKQLKQELHRKEKALAEASALLVMKKKATLIWGAAEDD